MIRTFIKRVFIIFIVLTTLLIFTPIKSVRTDSLWTTLGVGMNSSVFAQIVDGSGNLYAGGAFTSAGGVPVMNIAKWNGNTWSALGNGVENLVESLALDGSGNLYAGGAFTSAGGAPANHIAKWDGSNWSTLGVGLNNSVYALAVDSNDNVYAGGLFTTAGGAPANYIAKWDGSSWSALGSGTDNYIWALAIDSFDNLYAGGSFSLAGGASSNNIAKWDGSSWSALGSGMNFGVFTLTLDASNNLYAGGAFSKAGGTQVNYIAKWNGSAWSAFGTGINQIVRAVVIDGLGNVYAGGQFTSAGGVAANRIARWDGSAWSALGSGLNGVVFSLTADGSNNLYSGGNFTLAGGVPANYIAKWIPDYIPPAVATTTPANGATVLPMNSVLVSFSEDVTHNGGLNAADNPANYLLVEAKGNGFQTTACNNTDFVHDTKISIDSAVYDNHEGSGPFEVTLSLNQGAVLPNGSYRLFVCGTTSITDLSGNKINFGEVDSIVSFLIATPSTLPQTGFAPGTITHLPSQPAEKSYHSLDSLTLEIPSFNIRAPIIGIPQNREGWDLAWLGNQVGWLEGTAFPSWAGNSALTAHVVDANGAPGLFADLGQLTYGKEIIISGWGQRYVYQVRSVKTTVKPSDMNAIRHQGYPYLTLITCKGYDENSGNYRWRVVVQAVQVRVE